MNKVNDLVRYTESSSIDSRLIKKAQNVELRESLNRCSTKLRESFESDVAEGWWIPISFYNKKNGNGRIYNKQLWENVVNNQRDTYVGAPMLADHPAGDSDGSPKDICGVWLDAKMGEQDYNGIGLVYGLLVPSGHIGEDLKDHLKKGLRVGTSSSGFGKLMSDGVTVDPNSYVIERLSDWVLNPSQGTFFSYDESEDCIEDSSNYNESLDRENLEKTNNTVTIKEKSVKDSKITKLEEKKFRRDMESFLESANNIRNPQERLEEFKEIKSYLEDGACADLKEQIEQKIALEEAYIKQAIEEKMTLNEELGIESPKDLKQKLTKIAEDVQLLNKESSDWKAIAEKLQTKLDETKKELDSRHTNTFVEFQKNKISQLEKEIETQNNKYSEMAEKMTIAYKRVREDLETKQEECSNLSNEKCELEGKCDELAESLKTSADKVTLTEKSASDVAEELKEAKELITKLTSLCESQRKKIEESVSINSKLSESNKKKAEQIKELSKYVKRAETQLKESKKENARLTAGELNSVETYFESLYKQYGNDVLPYETRIKGCRTLSEAKTFFFKNVLENLTETRNIDRTRLPENMSFSAEERESFVKNGKTSKSSSIDRLPKGWF